ncbi:MAG: MucB/RseB C-terminal domain-containing protein [Candidatus Thiodiazotropha sp.]|jgi:sigma-E factor negative regulatory protein RseB
MRHDGFRPRFLIPLVLLINSQALLATGGELSARDWLERMMDAVQHLNYQGTFIYLHDNQLETMRIVHAVENDQVRESLTSLNGNPREVIRDKDSVTCVIPETNQVSVDRRSPSGKFLNLLPDDLAQLERHYTFHLLSGSRIANHQARIVIIAPRDGLRYGYRFYLDTDSGLPLKSDLMNEQGLVVEQTMFTDLQVGKAEINDIYHRESLYTYQLKNNAGAVDDLVDNPATRWNFQRLPSGFKLTFKHYIPDPEGAVPIEQYVFSDGLGSLSVFVEQGQQADGLSGASRLGAINAWGGNVEGFQVTAVGEVPSITLLGVVHGMKLKR